VLTVTTDSKPRTTPGDGVASSSAQYSSAAYNDVLPGAAGAYDDGSAERALVSSWGNDMWYLPAGPAFFQNSNQAITQTAEGISVGGIDLLDFMTMDSSEYTAGLQAGQTMEL
jgi:hypothetical protein